MKVTEQQQSREQMAWEEVGHTDVRTGAAWTLILIFLAVIYAVPLHQHVEEWKADRPMQSLDLWRHVPEIFRPIRERGLRVSSVIDANRVFLRRINEYEDDLEDASLAGQIIRPTVQSFMASRLGVGNEQAYVGRDGWLFYRPGMDSLTGPGFLDERQLARRAASGTEWRAAPQPDPRKAILDFKRQLDERGITLIVMPTPIKPTIHPERFSARYTGHDRALHNPSYQPFIEELEAEGVIVFDPSGLLLERKTEDGTTQYLATDTHWRPEAMEAAAVKLADLISGGRARRPAEPQPAVDGSPNPPPEEASVGLAGTRNHTQPETATPTDLPSLEGWSRDSGTGVGSSPPAEGWPKAGVGSLRRQPVQIAALGDISLMLDLPADQTIFPPEPVTIQQVLTDDGQFWRASEDAEVLVLGDSFSNIYSLEPMGWGESAGFIEQLSFHLGAPIDRLVRNDSGAFATRDMLSRELARGHDRLAGKRIVIWQFAARELAVGDWRIIPLELQEPPDTQFVVPAPGETLTVTGVVQAVSLVPRPGTVPYRDHIVSIHLVDIDDGEAVVYMHSMTDNEWTRAARLRIGEEITVALRPWSDVADQYDAINRSELDDWELQIAPPAWGEMAK